MNLKTNLYQVGEMTGTPLSGITVEALSSDREGSSLEPSSQFVDKFITESWAAALSNLEGLDEFFYG